MHTFRLKETVFLIIRDINVNQLKMQKYLFKKMSLICISTKRNYIYSI